MDTIFLNLIIGVVLVVSVAFVVVTAAWISQLPLIDAIVTNVKIFSQHPFKLLFHPPNTHTPPPSQDAA